MRTVFFSLMLFALIVMGGIFFYNFQKSPFTPHKTPAGSASYEVTGPLNASISIFDDDVAQISHISITPDGKYMLVSTLPGVIWAYHKTEGGFLRQTDPFFTLATSMPGFPPQEAGLTGIAFGADFATSGDVFLTYSFAQEKRSFRNRVQRVTFTHWGKKVIGTNAKQIFEAKAPGTGSHQIQSGVGVMVAGKPHFLFPIGEGFVAKRALDPSEEAGKVMLITRDGADPVGTRPFPQFPKIQALGIRNAPAMTQHPTTGKIAMGDTGPDNYDRFLYGTILDRSGKTALPISFNWEGNEESLKKPAPDLYDQNKDMVLHRWAPTETPVNIVFYAHDALPKLGQESSYVLVDLFGRTGETTVAPGKTIMMGTLTEGAANTLSLAPFIRRTAKSEGQLAHPIGLAVDPSNGAIYFGDIMEGRIYTVIVQ